MVRSDSLKTSKSYAASEDTRTKEEKLQFVACPRCGEQAGIRSVDGGCTVECSGCGVEALIDRPHAVYVRDDVFEHAVEERVMFVIDGPIGCGKTSCIERVVVEDKRLSKVLWIALNDGLARYYASRNGLECNLAPGFWDDPENLNRACISMDSLWMLETNQLYRKWDTVVIDDCMFIMDNVFSPSLSDNLGETTRAMSEAIKASTRTIIAGHSISQDCVDFFSELSANMAVRPIKFLKPSIQQPAQCYYGEEGHHQLQSKILDFYNKNKTPFIIVANGSRLAEELYLWLNKSIRQKITNKCSKIKLISEYLISDPDWTTAFLTNPNDTAILQHCDVLVIDPSMKSGYSFDSHFTTSFEFLASNKVPPVDQRHLTTRLRNITHAHKFTWNELGN